MGGGPPSGGMGFGINERFDLDFEPVDQPAVTYKAATGEFQLLLTRPAEKTRKPIAIDFDTVAPKMAKPQHHVMINPEHLALAKPSQQSIKMNVVSPPPAKKKPSALPDAAQEYAWVLPEDIKAAEVVAAPVISHAKKVVADTLVTDTKLKEAAAKVGTVTIPIVRPIATPQASVQKEFVDAEMQHLRDSEVKTLAAIRKAEKQDMEGLRKVTSQVKHDATSMDKDQAARVKSIADEAKKFIADAHLGDAQKDMASAFAPLDLGLVMLEMHHRVHRK